MALTSKDKKLFLAAYGAIMDMELASGPVGLPGQTIAQGAAAAAGVAAPGGGRGSGKHVATAQGVAKYKAPLGSMIVPHQGGGKERWVKGAPGHMVHGYISEAKWLANQWHGKPKNFAARSVQKGTHHWVQTGEHHFAVHKGLDVHVPKHIDTNDPVAVKNSPKIVVKHGEGGSPSEHVMLHPDKPGGVGDIIPHNDQAADNLAKNWKKLPPGVPKKSVAFDGQHAAHIPHDWQVYKAKGKADSELTAKWAKDPQGKWHFIGKDGEQHVGNAPGEPDKWVQKGSLVPEEDHPGPAPEHIAPQGTPGHEPVKVDVGGVLASKHDIMTALQHLTAAKSTNVKGPLKSKGHPLAFMDYMGISKAELAAHPELKVSPGSKQAHVGQVKLAVIHHLHGKLNQIAQTEAEQAVADKAAADAKAAAELAAQLTPALKEWGGVEANKEQLAEAADWLLQTMGGHGSFKQAMTKAGNPLAQSDYMGAAKTYLKSHPSAKGSSTKKLMLDSIMELTNLAQKADEATGHDVHAQLHEKLTAPGAKLKSGWTHSADGATTGALLAAAHGGHHHQYAYLGSEPGVWMASMVPPEGKGYLEATPEHVVTVHYASGGSHRMDTGNVADIVSQWLTTGSTEPVADAVKLKKEKLQAAVDTTKKLQAEKLAKDEEQVLAKLQKPAPKKPLAAFPGLTRFLAKEPGPTKSGEGDTLPKQIGNALLQSKKNGFPIYVGHVQHSGNDAEHSWIWQFVKPGPSADVYYRVEALPVQGEWFPSLLKYEKGEVGQQVYSLSRIAEIVKGKKPEVIPEAKPKVKLPDVSGEHFSAQKPSAEWITTEPEWADIHALVIGAKDMKASDLPDMESTDGALANALWITSVLKQEQWLVPAAWDKAGWSSFDNPPTPGSYGASTAAGYYKVTPEHQVIQFDKEGNQVALPGEMVLQFAQKLAGKQQDQGFDVHAAGTLYHAPAGSKVYVDKAHPDMGGQDQADVKYVKHPDGTWTYVQANKPGLEPIGKPAFYLVDAFEADLKSGKLVPWPKEGKAEGLVPVAWTNIVQYQAPAGTTLWHDVTDSPVDSEFAYVYMKLPDGTWLTMTGKDKEPYKSANAIESLNEGIKLGDLVPYGPEAEAFAKKLGAKTTEKKPEQADFPVTVKGKQVTTAPAGSTVWHGQGGTTETVNFKYIHKPDGTWEKWGSTGLSHASVGDSHGYDAWVKKNILIPDKGAVDAAFPPKQAQTDVPVEVNGKEVGKAPAGSKVYWYSAGTDSEAQATAKYVHHPDGSWWVMQENHKDSGAAGGYNDYVLSGAMTLAGEKPGAGAFVAGKDSGPKVKAEPEVKPDIPVIVAGEKKGMVPAGTKFYKITDQYGSEWTYLEKPDGTWSKTKKDQSHISTAYGASVSALGDKLKVSEGPTEEQIAHVAELADLKKKLDNGTVKPGKSESWGQYLTYQLTAKGQSYLHSEITMHQDDNGTWNSWGAPTGKDYWKVNPKTLTAQHIIPPSPKNEQTITEEVPFEEVKAAINEHMVPDAVNLSGQVYKHGFWYNPKGKAYLEIKASGYGGYYGHNKAKYYWHGVNGSTKEVTHTFAENALAKNTEYQPIPKPVEVTPGVAAQAQFATTLEPGDFKLYSSKEPGNVSQSYLTVHGDGSAHYHDFAKGSLEVVPTNGVDALIKGGTLLDAHGNTVIKPGVIPGAYHIFGSDGKTEAQVTELLHNLEQADSHSWQHHLYKFFGTGKEFAGGGATGELFSKWWSDKQAVTKASQHESMKALARELLLIPQQKAAVPFEPAFLKSMPDGIHSSKQVFGWTKNGWAVPYSGLLNANWVHSAASPELSDKIKAVSAQFGGGKVVGTHPASMTKDQKQAWLKAWKNGDMASVFTIDSHTGKVSPVHPGAPKNAVTHSISWSPLDPAQVPASSVIEGDWTASDIIMPNAEVDNYLIKMGFQHAEYLTEAQKRSLVKAHREHIQDAVDATTKLANEKFETGGVHQTATPAWTEGLKPAHSYDAWVQKSQSAGDWPAQAVTDFIADHPDKLAAYQQPVLEKHGYSSWSDLPSYYQAEAIQDWLDDAHAKEVEEKSVPVWKEVPLGPVGSHGHEIAKFTKTIPYTGEVTTWYVKPPPKAGAEWRLEQEHAANTLGRLFGFNTAQSEMTPVAGKSQLAIAEIKGKMLGHYTDLQPLSTFTPIQIAEMAGEHALDWVLANDDTSANNMIERLDGHLVGIDKGRAWGNMSWPGLAGDDSMNTMTQVVFGKLYAAVRSHEISKEVADQAFTHLIHKMRKMSAVPDAKVRAIMEAGFASRPTKYGSTEDIINETIARKNSLEADFTKMWAKVYADAGYASTAEDPHAAGGAWGPIKGKPTYGMLLFDDEGKIMLREPSNHFGGYAWTFAKGGANPGETPLETAIRETAEETDLKAGESIGYVPGGFGGTTSTAYFHLGLKSSTTHHPEMNNGETWNVKWVTKDEAKELIAQTESETGKARDLQILETAFAAHAAAKAKGFPAIASASVAPGVNNGLPYIPEAKLPVGPNGVQLHSGFSEPDYMDHVAASKSFGTPAFFGGPGMEYGHVITWREFEGSGTDKPVIRGETGARGKALHSLLSWAKAHVTGGAAPEVEDETQVVYPDTTSEGFPGRAPEGSPDRGELTGELTVYNQIITAARTVSRHALDKKFNASAMQNLEQAEQKLTETLTGMEAIPTDNPWRMAAEPVVKLYLSHIAAVQSAKETAKTFANDELPRYLAPPKAKEKPKPAPVGVKVSLVSPTRPATEAADGALNQDDGELHTGQGTTDYQAGSAKVFRVTLPTGEQIDIWGGAENHVELAHRGHIKFKAVAADGAASLERIREQLVEMGLPMDEATPDDLELYYWRHLYGVLGDRRDGPNGSSSNAYKGVTDTVDAGKKAHGVGASEDLAEAGLSPDEELAIWRKAWATVTSEKQVESFTENGGHLPHLKHYNLHDPTIAGGRPTWMRFDVSADMVAKWKMPDHVFYTHPEIGAVRITRSGGQFSKDFRYRHLGLNLQGQGNGPDTGATDFVFGNLNSEQGHVIVSPRTLAFTQNYGWDGDNWGRLGHRHSSAYFNAQKASEWHGMETMFPGSWTLLDDIEAVRANSEGQRKQIIGELKAKGIHEIRGMPVEDRIATSANWSETKKKIRANWAAHPELLDPHSEWNLTSTAGAEHAESGKTAAHAAKTPETPAEKVITDPANKVYTNVDIPGYMYVQLPAGDWQKITPDGKMLHKPAGLGSAEVYAKYVKDGTFQQISGPKTQPPYPGVGGPGEYTYKHAPGVKYEKHPDGSWTITDNGKPTTWAAATEQAKSLSGSADDGKLTPVEGKPKSPDEVLADPANEVFVNPPGTGLQGKQYVKDAAGGWYMVKDHGDGNITMNYYKPGTGSAADYSDLANSGGLVKSAAKTPTITKILADPANTFYVNSNYPDRTYVKTPSGSWYVIKGDSLSSVAAGSYTAKNYDNLVNSGDMAITGSPAPVDKTEATQLLFDPANAVYTHPDSPGVKYVRLPNGTWKVIQLSGKVLSYTKGDPGAALAEEMVMNGEFEQLAAPDEGAPLSAVDVYGNNYVPQQLIPTHIPYGDYIVSGSITGNQLTYGSITSNEPISVWDYDGNSYHEYAQKLSEATKAQEKALKESKQAQEELLRLLVSPPIPSS